MFFWMFLDLMTSLKSTKWGRGLKKSGIIPNFLLNTWNVFPVSSGTVQLMGSGDLIISCSGDLTRVGSGGDWNSKLLILILSLLWSEQKLGLLKKLNINEESEELFLYLHYGLLEVVDIVLYSWGRPADIPALSLAAGWPGDSSLPCLSVCKMTVSVLPGPSVLTAGRNIMRWTGRRTRREINWRRSDRDWKTDDFRC